MASSPIRTVQLPSGEPVPVLGQGTWQMGESAVARDEELRTLQVGLDLGLTLIDTAEMYADGGAEELVADAIEGRRDEVFLVSKVLPSNASRHGTIEACERSLKRLRTEQIDLYLLHWRGRLELGPTIEAFAQLKADGKIRHWGVSNLIALAWVLRNDNVFAVPKASSPEHVRENARALDIRLDADDLKRLDDEFPPPHRPEPLPLY